MINIYVDGSYNQKLDKVGWAWVKVIDDKIIEKENGVKNNDYKARNVEGELFAVINALYNIYNLPQLTKDINIYYDYLGIEYWVNGKWKANKELTQKYKKIVNNYIEIGYKINFIKVKSHSGNKYNEVVDKLAKEACGVI